MTDQPPNKPKRLFVVTDSADSNRDEDNEIRSEIDAARAGDARAARFLLERFAEAVRTNTYPKALMQYFGRATEAYLSWGHPLEQGLHLKRPKRPRGRPRADMPQDRWAKMVLAASVVAKRASGLTYEEAVAETTEAHHASESSVQRAFADFKEFMRRRRQDLPDLSINEHSLVMVEGADYQQPVEVRPIRERDVLRILSILGAFDDDR